MDLKRQLKTHYTMEASNLELTADLLNEEFTTWLSKFKNGRNADDLRFGQYIWCKYDVGKLFPVPNSGLDGFAAESPLKAFHQILEKL
jgi:hypothetical protein